jgi:hypothetical protein
MAVKRNIKDKDFGGASPFQVKVRSVNEPSVGGEGNPLPMEVSFIRYSFP